MVLNAQTQFYIFGAIIIGIIIIIIWLFNKHISNINHTIIQLNNRITKLEIFIVEYFKLNQGKTTSKEEKNSQEEIDSILREELNAHIDDEQETVNLVFKEE